MSENIPENPPQPPAPTPPDAPVASTPIATVPTPSPAIHAPTNSAPNLHRGRRYGFLCSYCSSRLEAVESMAGHGGTCPTCGNAIIIPILDSRGRLIDPTSGQVIKQDPHPVHAYAAAGHKAPVIVTLTTNGDRLIQCPRCNRQNPLAANNCLGCGLPFTMEGTAGDSISGSNTWAVASLVLGIIGIVGGFCIIIPPLLAVIFGFMGMRDNSSSGARPSGQGLAIAGLILGVLGLLIAGLVYSGSLRGIL
jgi:DNA-directed RNA polymerase subunit RPC12/RpoP